MKKKYSPQELLAQIISINSVNPTLDPQSRGEAELAHFIGNYLDQIGLVVKYQVCSKGRENVIGILPGSGGGKKLMINGHLDTVSTKGMVSPLTPKLIDGKMFGRGSFDMKGGLTSMILAIEAVVQTENKLKGDVILAFVVDEEYTSKGTEILLEEFSADSGIICEPTNEQIILTHKGYIWLNFTIFGVAAHGSMPDKGVDAIINAAKILGELDELQNVTWKKMTHPLLGNPTLHASKIDGGIGISTYPDECQLSVEMRTLPGQTVAVIEEQVNSILVKLTNADPKFKAKVDIYFSRRPLETSEKEDIVDCLSKSYRTVINQNTEFSGVPYWTDAALMDEKNITTVLFGPNGDGAHAAVEYVELESVMTVAKVLEEVILKYCK